MPAGVVRGAVSTGLFPVSLSTKFTESHSVMVRTNEYHDGTSQRQSMVAGGRRSWKASKRLTVSELQTLSDHWGANRNTAFGFYNPSETNPPFTRNPSGSSGYYLVRYASDWEDTVGMARSDASVELIELVSDAEIAAAVDPLAQTPSSVVIAVESAFDQGAASAHALGSFFTTFAFSQFPFLSSENASYATRTDGANVTNWFGVRLSTPYDLNHLSAYFSIAGTSLGDSGLSKLRIYSVSLSVTWPDGSLQVLRPTTAIWDAGQLGDATVSNPSFAIDGDSSTFAEISQDNWGPLVIDGTLRLTNFQ